MSSRESILSAIRNNQPKATPLPDLDVFRLPANDLAEKFKMMATRIGATIKEAPTSESAIQSVKSQFGPCRLASTIKFEGVELIGSQHSPHELSSVEVAIISGQFGVAENGSIWVNQNDIAVRALPFICQHLVILLNAGAIVSTMHEAYDRIKSQHYDFGSFLAGPSKTADIEQSLVLGAHGSRTLTIFLLD